MRTLSIRESKMFYVVVDIPFPRNSKKVKDAGDIRVYEVSPSSGNKPGHPNLGIGVGAKNAVEAWETVKDILEYTNIKNRNEELTFKL